MKLNTSFKTLCNFALFGGLSAYGLNSWHWQTLFITLQLLTRLRVGSRWLVHNDGVEWSTLSRELILQLVEKSRKNVDVFLGVCSADIWQSEGTVTVNEGEPTGDTVTTKIINIFAHARLTFATEPQETSQWKRLFAFGSNNLNRRRAISLRLWTPGHTLGHLATGVPFSCALQQAGIMGLFPTPFPRTINFSWLKLQHTKQKHTELCKQENTIPRWAQHDGILPYSWHSGSSGKRLLWVPGLLGLHSKSQ